MRLQSAATSDAAAPVEADTGRWPQLRAATLLAGLGGMAVGAAVVALLAIGLQSGIGFVDDPNLGLAPGTGSLSAVGNQAARGDEPQADPPAELLIDVGGAVMNPGLHRLREGDRVGDAIASAGGLSPRADLAETGRTLNLALPLVDGGKVVVPELGAVMIEPVPASVDDGLIDLNSADQARLETLPGIGPVTAARILDSRREEPFETVRELRSRGVVGAAVYDRIRDMVSVRS